ncbi:hypothetical protein LG329_18500 [Virgibacillus necropolis]|uniref:hypothetical protein n=1 Tax=Virgibacillus necropolis TaxID=163877 RepID=UPI00384CA2B9
MDNFKIKDLLRSRWFVVITIIKIITICVWLPKEIIDTTIPFILHFLATFENPWQFFYENNESLSTFPYPSGMLYILSLFFWPINFSIIHSENVQVFLIQLPTLLADVIIYYFLLKTYPAKQKYVTLIYYGSPIIFIAGYIYPNHDLIPIAALLISVFYLIRKNHLISAVMFGIAFSIKMPVIFALPLLLIYLIKSNKKVDVLKYSLVVFLCWSVLVSPFLLSKGYQMLVFNNDDQFKMFDIYFEIDYLKIYIAPLFIALMYIHFLRFEKINADLLYTYLGMLYFAFVLFIPPMPHWYAWSFVFASVFFINTFENKHNMYQYFLLTAAYLGYFILFYPNTNQTLQFIAEFLHLNQYENFLPNVVFTLFQGILLFLIWIFYRYGIISNSLYKVNMKPTVIGIGGDSGVGKTRLTMGLMKLFGSERLLIVEGDGDHKWERGHEKWSEFTHLNPKANFLHEQAATLERLKNGASTNRVEYDHGTGKFTTPKKIDPNDFIIMCGLHPLLLSRTRKVADLKIYVDTDEKLRRHWKIIRDCEERGYTIDKVMRQLDSRMEDAKKYIYPQKEFADLIIKYFTESQFVVGDVSESPTIKLKLTCDANLLLENITNKMDEYEICYLHDYDNNLKHQVLILKDPIEKDVVNDIATSCIKNLNEVTRGQIIEWSDGYEAFIQLILLVHISEKMKGS